MSNSFSSIFWLLSVAEMATRWSFAWCRWVASHVTVGLAYLTSTFLLHPVFVSPNTLTHTFLGQTLLIGGLSPILHATFEEHPTTQGVRDMTANQHQPPVKPTPISI